MKFICQQQSIDELHVLASSNRHSVLIDGPEGSGKNISV